MKYNKHYSNFAKKRFIKCSENIKLILAESILILPISRENNVINRYFLEKKKIVKLSIVFLF